MNDQQKNVNLERQARDLGVDPQALAAFVEKQQQPKALTEAELAAKAKELGVDQVELAEFLARRKKAQGTKEDLLTFAEEAGNGRQKQTMQPVVDYDTLFAAKYSKLGLTMLAVMIIVLGIVFGLAFEHVAVTLIIWVAGAYIWTMQAKYYKNVKVISFNTLEE